MNRRKPAEHALSWEDYSPIRWRLSRWPSARRWLKDMKKFKGMG